MNEEKTPWITKTPVYRLTKKNVDIWSFLDVIWVENGAELPKEALGSFELLTINQTTKDSIYVSKENK